MFKDNLVSVRKMHGFSQDELAEKIGVSRQTLSKYEQENPYLILRSVNSWQKYWM